MVIGTLKEIKNGETRVGLVPSGVVALRESGHEVLVEAGAGEGSSIPDKDYRQAGAIPGGLRRRRLAAGRDRH